MMPKMTPKMAPQLDYFQETPSQTAGPYVHIGLIPHQAGFDIFEKPFGNKLAGPDTPGEHIGVEGRVLDGLGAPCRDVLLEIWQANTAGRYNHPADRQIGKALDTGFRGWGRTGTDFATGLYRFETVKPGAVVGRRGHKPMAPHVNLWLAARGINIGLATRIYFEDEKALNEQDPVLRMVEPAERRETLLARREEREGAVVYVFDIRLQGERETLFFDV
ncbi:protocatechuate 3,4-dioxygenase alpha subunit [Rhizobiales bacterium GAS188]|nr:protocatechuate 3,4-dioxygenase alpha subunit [Rhizobiales bacterium GAS188]